MEIRDFSNLTDFVYDEYLKMTENFGIKKPSDSLIDYTEKTLKKYIKLYDKPLYRKAKRELILAEAIDTMPHGCVWKFFHYSLWQKVKRVVLENEKIKDSEQEGQAQSLEENNQNSSA